MEFIPTDEQAAIINADLSPLSVIACPGSGKTATAVRRVVEMRRRLGDSRGHVALLSYSNVAVETFRAEYSSLAAALPELSSRVLIETVDAFFTTYLLRPHGARTMGALRQPFLVQGTEPFLSSFKIFDGKYPHDISELRVGFNAAGEVVFTLQAPGKQPVPIESWKALQAVEKLGKIGAYTHELARYWAIKILLKDERLCGILSARFPHVVVDEAQDVGPLHGILLQILTQSGTSVSLIGDPNQGIYEFAGADGSFLREYSQIAGVLSFPLSQNRRSLRPIVDASNLIAGTKSTPFREAGGRKNGTYYIRYDEADLNGLLLAFEGILLGSQYRPDEAAVLCRGNATVGKLAGEGGEVGRGATGQFARAAILRDRNGDIAKAFECVVNALLRLLEKPADTLRRDLLSTAAEGDAKVLRQLLWTFLRSGTTGLPDSTLPAKSKWQPLLKSRTDDLLKLVEARTGCKRVASWTNNLTVAELGDVPLWKADLAGKVSHGIRVDTVHQAKGEGIPVVLYLARTVDLNKLVEGTTSEEGRIGYVAITRARDLLILGVPKTAKKSLLECLEAKGFVEWAG